MILQKNSSLIGRASCRDYFPQPSLSSTCVVLQLVLCRRILQTTKCNNVPHHLLIITIFFQLKIRNKCSTRWIIIFFFNEENVESIMNTRREVRTPRVVWDLLNPQTLSPWLKEPLSYYFGMVPFPGLFGASLLNLALCPSIELFYSAAYVNLSYLSITPIYIYIL